jgi:ABC-type transport system involved in cytochrome c biogenesis permease component
VEQQPPHGDDAQHRPPPRTRNPRVWVLVGVLLLIPMVVPLLVNTYAREEPALGGVPFFFWYQFLWIIIAVVLTTIAYRIVLRQERRDREAGER